MNDRSLGCGILDLESVRISVEAVLHPAIIMKDFLAIFDHHTRRLYNKLGDRELRLIADSMYEWEGRIAEGLELKKAEIEGIRTENPKELKLQT